MKRFVIAILVLLSGLALARAVGGAEPPLTNSDVIKMVKAGLGSETIVAKIKASETRFALDTDSLIALAQEKVPDAVIKAMMEKQPPEKAPAAAEPVAPKPESAAADKSKGQAVFHDIWRMRGGITGARGDFKMSDDAIEFVCRDFVEVCASSLVPHWEFSLKWPEIDSFCFEYAAMGTLIIKPVVGKEFTLKSSLREMEDVERGVRKARPKANYRCE